MPLGCLCVCTCPGHAVTKCHPQIVAFFDSLFMRLLGIGIASFSSGKHILYSAHIVANCLRLGLGELTFLQLSTTYAPPSVAGHSVGCALLVLVFVTPADIVQVFCLWDWCGRSCRRFPVVGGSGPRCPAWCWHVFRTLPSSVAC